MAFHAPLQRVPRLTCAALMAQLRYKLLQTQSLAGNVSKRIYHCQDLSRAAKTATNSVATDSEQLFIVLLSLMEQNPFGVTSDDLMLNPEPRCPSVVLLDVSGSMSGEPIRQLTEGLNLYRDELAADSMASKRVEVAVITFGGVVQVVQPFCNADRFSPLTFQANGDTPMGKAIVTGLDLLESRKAEIRQGGVGLFRPWVFLITDGGPTDTDTPFWPQAKEQVHNGEKKGSFLFFAVGVKGANTNRLRELGSSRAPIMLDGLRFRDLFAWLSASQKMVSQSQPGDKLALPPVSWGSIEV